MSWNAQDDSSGLSCHCGFAIEEDQLGPEVFCYRNCRKTETEKCGGFHKFKNGIEKKYFSVYHIKEPEISNKTDVIKSNMLNRIGDNSDNSEDSNSGLIYKPSLFSLINKIHF